VQPEVIEAEAAAQQKAAIAAMEEAVWEIDPRAKLPEFN
jgi:hypothetical protein